MTALTIVGQACARLGITAPTALFSSTDDQIVQLRNLMNYEGQELSKGGPTDHAWQALTNEKTFTTVAAAIQTSAVPTDFAFYINDTMWNRTTKVKMEGPVSAEGWQTYQALTIVTIPFAAFRFRGGNLIIFPSPVASQTAAYEYVSNIWASGSQTAMTADSDTALLDEGLITLGVIWRFLAAKGLDYAEAFRTYQVEVSKAVGRDGGRKRYALGNPPTNRWNTNIPDGSW